MAEKKPSDSAHSGKNSAYFNQNKQIDNLYRLLEGLSLEDGNSLSDTEMVDVSQYEGLGLCDMSFDTLQELCESIFLERLNNNLPAVISDFTEYLQYCFLSFNQDSNMLATRLLDAMKFYCANNSTIALHLLSDRVLKTFIQLVMLNEDPQVAKYRKYFVDTLTKNGYFYNLVTARHYVYTLIRSGDPKHFKQFLDKKRIILDKHIAEIKQIFANSKHFNYKLLFLFEKLEPKLYQNKRWSKLTSYEKLYWLVFEQHIIKSLSHRIGLKGTVSLNWQGNHYKGLGIENVASYIDLTGYTADMALFILKQSLTKFTAAYKHPDEKLLAAINYATQEIDKIEPNFECIYRHRLRGNTAFPYIISLLEHLTTCLFSKKTNLYYSVNMGYGSGNYNGVRIYQTTDAQLLHSELASLQRMPTIDRFNSVAKRMSLTEFLYLKLPEQYSGNCSYESLKGLFLVYVFDYLFTDVCMKRTETSQGHQKTLSPTEINSVIRLALVGYRHFAQFDAKDAQSSYTASAISPNKHLLFNASANLEGYLNTNVYNNKAYGAYYKTSKGTEINIDHHDFVKSSIKFKRKT